MERCAERAKITISFKATEQALFTVPQVVPQGIAKEAEVRFC